MPRKIAFGIALAAILFLGVSPALRAVGLDAGPNIPLNDAAGGFWGLATQVDANGYQQPVTAQAGLHATSTMAGGTVTTANTFQSALAANAARRGCLIQNTGAAVLYVYFGLTASATTAASFTLAAGASIPCSQGQSVLTDNVAVTSATVSNAFVVDSW